LDGSSVNPGRLIAGDPLCTRRTNILLPDSGLPGHVCFIFVTPQFANK
jgi:hypothetical protein